MPQDLRDRVRNDFARTRDELESLIRIPSVSAPGFDPAEVRRSATATAQLLRDSGLQDVRLLEVEGAHPAVFGERQLGADRPTVLLYADCFTTYNEPEIGLAAAKVLNAFGYRVEMPKVGNGDEPR